MKVLVVLVCLVVGALAYPSVEVSAEEWLSFKTLHGKTYGSGEEELYRQKIYLENKQNIEAHNKLYESGQVSYELGMNQFGDLLHHEIKSAMLGLKPAETSKNAPVHVNSNTTIPSTVDWRAKGVVSPMKNQGLFCGSCWAFSTTGSVEGQLAIKTGKLVSLSEQNLLDCSSSYGNQGCSGGLMDSAFQYIKDNGGIDTEESYPYTSHFTTGTCAFDKTNSAGTITGFVDIKSGSEDDLQDAIATVGPISVGIDASSFTFAFYRSGVYSPWFCSAANIDHGVLAVGYGTENGKDYWLIKNSWGTWWGDSGYFKLIKNGKNVCGIATQASYPTV